MEDHLENFGEEDMDKVVENTDEKRGLDGNLGANGSKKRELDGNLGADSTEKRWPGWPGESVFRILVSSQKIGGIIGRKGEYIKKMCEESRARIKILDGPQGVPERAVMISAKEEQDASISPAMDGLLKVHKRTVDGLDKNSSLAPSGNMVFTRLLVPATQAGSLIGKHGTTIKSIQEGSNCIIRILEDLPHVALHDDRVVEIQGEPIGVHKAVELISCHLRKFLVDRSVLALFEMQMQMPHPHMNQNIPPPQPCGPPQCPPNTGGSVYSGNPGYGYRENPGYGGNQGYGCNPNYGNPPFMPPPHPHDNFYPPPEVPPFEKPPHHGISTYGREAPVVGATPAIQQPSPMASHFTQHMQIPLSYADAVIGNAGESISYIRRTSGATVAVQESRGVPGEMTVEITGSATQVQAAQQLIQNFVAEAAAPATAAAPANPLGQPDQTGYNNSYPTVYSAPPTANNTAPSAYPAGAYGSTTDGTNYGY